MAQTRQSHGSISPGQPSADQGGGVSKPGPTTASQPKGSGTENLARNTLPVPPGTASVAARGSVSGRTVAGTGKKIR